MSKLIIFPGQGAQYGGMAKDLYEQNDKARAVLDEIFSYTDFDLKEIMFSEDDDRLNDTKYTQPALFAHSLAVLAATGLKGEYLLGHTRGELPPLVHAGTGQLKDDLKPAAGRDELMSQPDSGAKDAVIGMPFKELEDQGSSAPEEDSKVAEANSNAPEQVVVAGD